MIDRQMGNAMIHWTKLRVLALIVGLVGVWGVLRALSGLPTLFSRRSVPSLVFQNEQRLPSLDALEGLRTGFPSNFAIVFGFVLLGVLLAILFVALLSQLYEAAPVRTLLAGLFLGGSVLAVVPLAGTILKVSEFAFQATIATPDERRWFGRRRDIPEPAASDSGPQLVPVERSRFDMPRSRRRERCSLAQVGWRGRSGRRSSGRQR